MSCTRWAISVCVRDVPGVCVAGVLEGAGGVEPLAATVVCVGLVGVEDGWGIGC